MKKKENGKEKKTKEIKVGGMDKVEKEIFSENVKGSKRKREIERKEAREEERKTSIETERKRDSKKRRKRDKKTDGQRGKENNGKCKMDKEG